jgi:hypothetical protein
MGMKSPPHPGELIGDSLERLGMSISAAAKGLGITRQQPHQPDRQGSISLPNAAPSHRKWLCGLRRRLAAALIRGSGCR